MKHRTYTTVLASLLGMSSLVTDVTHAADTMPKSKDEVKRFMVDHFKHHDYGLWFNINRPFRTDNLALDTKCGASRMHRAPLAYRLMYDLGVIAVKSKLIRNSFNKHCEYTIVQYTDELIGKGLIQEKANGWYFIPLVKQKIHTYQRMGIQQVLNSNQPRCDFYMVGRLENTELSKFAKTYKDMLKKNGQTRNIYNKLVEGRFCAGLDEKSGKFKWIDYYRY